MRETSIFLVTHSRNELPPTPLALPGHDLAGGWSHQENRIIFILAQGRTHDKSLDKDNLNGQT